MEVTDTSGTTCIGVDSIVITTDAPTADFTADNVCEGTPVSLLDASTPATNGTIINWQWDIDNNGSTEYVTQNVFHVFILFFTCDYKYEGIETRKNKK